MSSIYNNYFLSEKVKVFPCAYRSNTYDATARLNTEYNFTHLPHMVDKKSYIIKFNDISENEPKAKLICVIQGYYFEIELGTDDFTTLQNKYLNICIASPSSSNSIDFIEGPHLCSWASSKTEEELDYPQVKSDGSTVYLFGGLQISEPSTTDDSDGKLSKAGYQCYALKLDASAKLPISANKIENNAGIPISTSFTTGTLSATTSTNTQSLNVASDKLIVNSSSITANVPVTINNTLDVKTGDTSVLKAESDQVAINKPTTIIGTTTIKGTTKIENSQSAIADGNLMVSGTGNFGGKLAVSSGGASITGSTQITGKTTIGTDTNKTEIEHDTVTTSKITVGSLVINKNTDHILTIENKTSNEAIFYVDIESGETYAKKINAEVEGTSANAVNAKNVTTSIGNTSIKSIFETNGLVVQKASSLTATSSTASAGNIIITGNTTDTVDALIPAKTKGRTYNIGSSAKTFDNIYATTFHGSLTGNASTANNFSSGTTVELTGNITGTSSSSTKGWTVDTTIANNAVTKTKIKDGEVTNAKLANDSITIGENEVVLGESIGDISKPFRGTLCFGGLSSEKDCKIVLIGQYKKSKMEFPLEIKDGSKSLIQFTNNYGASDSISVPKQIIYAATTGTSDNQKGRTELFGDKICIYNQGYDYTSGTIEAGTIDLSANNSNIGLKISGIHQIKVNGAGLKSSSSIKIVGTTVKLCDNALVVASGEVKIGSKLTLTTSNGNIESKGIITAASFNATSDRRLKENIIDYKPEKSILDLPIKKFDFIDGPKNQIGCIAQDLKEICPEIVNENEKGYLSIQENKLIYLLLDEVKKLKNEVEKLKNK